MAVIDGGEFRVYLDGVALAFATSSTINLTTEVDKIAPTSVSAANTEVIKPRMRSGSISSNALYGTSGNKDFKDLFTAWKNDTAVTIAFKSNTTGEWNIASQAYITNLSATGAVLQDSSLRATFTLSGEITLTDIV